MAYEQGKYGLWAQDLSMMVPMVRDLLMKPQQYFELVSRAHERARDFQLEVLLLWRMEFYRHLNRLAESLERSLDRRFPIQKAVL